MTTLSSSSSSSNEPLLHIVSWNVAGLATTLQRLAELYPQESNALEYFLERHDMDFLCLQEHKIPLTQLSHRLHKQIVDLERYDSFWSPTTSAGLNGVATLVRKGLTESATAAVFKDQGLDSQGRCLKTTHADFVLYNIYAPCNGGHSLEDKMKFLDAIHKSILSETKPTILVGDFNITHTKWDKYWKDRVLLLNPILQNPSTESWQEDIQKAWVKIAAALAQRQVIETQTTNPQTGAKFQKYRLAVTLPDKRVVYLGKHESKPEYCDYEYNLEASYYTNPDTGDSELCHASNTLSMSVLVECLTKIAGIEWSHAQQRNVADSSADVCPHHPPRRWLQKLAKTHTDVFRHFHPTALGRFTCWNQFTNRRYENEGSRIDYIWVDSSLLNRARKGFGALLEEELSEQAALEAATCDGRYQPVGYQGGGIAEASLETVERHYRPKLTGMIYTPPSWSDHIAISLVMSNNNNLQQAKLCLDKETRNTQPHLVQPSIASYFGKKQDSNVSNLSTHKKRTLKPDVKRSNKKTLLHHFGVASGPVKKPR
jgi:exonuclease III